MFGIGMPELILILVVALIVIGPKKLPDMAKSLGRAVNEFKSATQDFKDSIDTEVKDIKNLDKTDMGQIGKSARQKPGPDKETRPGEEPSNGVESNGVEPSNEGEPGADADTDIKTGVPEYDGEAPIKQKDDTTVDE